MVNCKICGLPFAQSKHQGEEHLCQACNYLTDKSLSVNVSPLSSNDLELVLAWRSHPQIYKHFRRQSGPLDWDDHVSWFNSRDPDRYDFIINYDGRRVGVVNINESDEVGIFVGDFSAHGHGVATAALEWLCRRFADRTPLFAEVHENNGASKQLFDRCGFHQNQADKFWLQYKYSP